MSKRFLFWVFVGSICLSFALYGNTLPGEFVWDDVFFTKRPELAQLSHLPKLLTEPVLPDSPAAGLYRPLTMFTFSANLLLGGQQPVYFHLVSILLNGLVTFLVFCLVWALFKNKPLAFFTALFFAFLPIHTEAVALIKARDELLAAALAISSWLAFLKATKGRLLFDQKWLAASAGLFFLGLLAKEFTVVIPSIFFLVLWAQKEKPWSIKNNLLDLWPGGLWYGATFLVYLWLRHLALPNMSFGNDDIGPLSNILVVAPWWAGELTAFKIAYLYIAKTLVPLGLTASYHFKAVTLVGNIFYSWRAMVGLAALAGLIVVAAWKKTRHTPLGIGAIVFLVLYLPVSQFIFKGGDIMGERWMYLPSLGIALMVGGLFSYLYKIKPKAVIIVFGFILVCYAFVLIPRNLVWRTPLSLYESMVADSPKSVRGYASLAQYYFENGRFIDAKKMIDQGLAISNQEPAFYVVASSIAYQQKEYKLAEEFLRKALALPTFSSSALLNFPRVLFVQGHYQEALDWYDQYIVLLPATSIGFQEKVLYASILTKLGHYERSTEYIKQNLVEYLDIEDVQTLLKINDNKSL